MAKEYEIIASWIVLQLKYSPETEKVLARIFLDRNQMWTLGNIEQVPKKEVPVSPNTNNSATPYWPGNL